MCMALGKILFAKFSSKIILNFFFQFIQNFLYSDFTGSQSQKFFEIAEELLQIEKKIFFAR